MNEEKVAFHFQDFEKFKVQVQQIAKERGISVADVCREAVREYLGKRAKP